MTTEDKEFDEKGYCKENIDFNLEIRLGKYKNCCDYLDVKEGKENENFI